MKNFGLYDPQLEKSNCGVGFLTRKSGEQTHDLLLKGHEALCAIPHRGGMSSEGVGDGAGVSLDLSIKFFSKISLHDLKQGEFGVGNFFLPENDAFKEEAELVVETALKSQGLNVLKKRVIPVNNKAVRPAAIDKQLPICQWIFVKSKKMDEKSFTKAIYKALLKIEEQAFQSDDLYGLYPLSLSAQTQVLKGRLNSHEIIPYFSDLSDPDHEIHTMYFHTRFSTNTDPHPSMAQPFRFMAHNGELNTDKKNRLSEAAIARAKKRNIFRPPGQSDSCRLDQTLQSRVINDDLDLVTAVVSMMPPAWENDKSLSPQVRAMFEFFSLYEEKNDGPAALIFGNGNIIGARLDRLGLRPLRTIETNEYLAVMSEAGQIVFDPATVISRGRIEAGGMLYYDHEKQQTYKTNEAMDLLAKQKDYKAMLEQAQIHIDDLASSDDDPKKAANQYKGDLERDARYVAYSHNQESFRFLMDPMLEDGAEKISAMGYGNAINVLSDYEGGIAKYFSQRFAQVTNPPLDSIREADGMTLRVALGEKPQGKLTGKKQIVLKSPILKMAEILKIREQSYTPVADFEMLYKPVFDDKVANEKALVAAINNLCDEIEKFAEEKGGIAIISDRHISKDYAALPMIMVVSAINQRLIEAGLKLRMSLIVESGQMSSSHHIACALGFGASAVYPIALRIRAEEKFASDPTKAYFNFAKAAEKALMKTMGKVGLCTVESYSGGEFFEPNFLNTNDPVLQPIFPNMKTPVGGVGYPVIAQSVADWHQRALNIETASDIPMLGLFKERSEGAGHTYGTIAVRGFVDMTEEKIRLQSDNSNEADDEQNTMRLLTLNQMSESFGINEDGYVNTTFDRLSKTDIDKFKITPGYRAFSKMMKEERHIRPSALRDILAFPADIRFLTNAEDMRKELTLFNLTGNKHFIINGLEAKLVKSGAFEIELTGPLAKELSRFDALGQALVDEFGAEISGHWLEAGKLFIECDGKCADFLNRLKPGLPKLDIKQVQPASEITPTLASGAMSHGALVASAHEAVAHGTNIVGGMSNSGEGGEHISRYGTIRASKIKQFASGRFGVWTGYLADPSLEEIEIKIGQGAKPGEGGQLPAQKVTVEIAAARGGTPGVELISPPPHHDTYSIEDLAQLIHDAKSARVRVVVKLVSSEGIGTIAVGVAKAGADVINVAGNTGGTGAASVTSLKYTGRAAEIGIAEVHQALCANGLRQKVVLRCSGAHQTGSDVVKSALLGGDSFEFGTTALMMLKCVMAKNCNVKCPAGLTTNPEVFDGDPRALAQYLLNIAHEIREILAQLGLKSLREARGRSDLLHLIEHPSSVGELDLTAMLTRVDENIVEKPVYLERDFAVDDYIQSIVYPALFEGNQDHINLDESIELNNRNKSVGAQLAIDFERYLNHEKPSTDYPCVSQSSNGRRFLKPGSVHLFTHGSAGQSYAAFCNDGMTLQHKGTCNDGVGKGASGGNIIILSPDVRSKEHGENVLIGNFALFGATGGRTFIEGQAGDRFAVRNSGATAVVEGVGDFCCEYMTNGSVLNLGGFSKGFGNGMSGGFAYQYDPEGKLQDAISKDSVLTGSIADETDEALLHSSAVRTMLNWHFEATNSELAKFILDNWDDEKNHIFFIMPRALLQYQDHQEILASKSRKELIEELATSLAAFQVNKLKKAWRSGKSVVNGYVPDYGETDTAEMFSLLNNWTVLDKAQELALKRTPNAKSSDDPIITKVARNLILTEDFSLMSSLLRHAREAVTVYSNEELAVMIANKRLMDFKTSLAQRNVLSMDSPGTYGWILHQQHKNISEIGRIPSFEELFAKNTLPAMAMK